MYPVQRHLRNASGVAAWLAAALTAAAQLTTTPEPKAPDMETFASDIKIERKLPGLLHRPSKSSPAAQLSYADQLRAAGKLRRAANEYLALVHEWHESAEAPRAQFAAAQILVERGKKARAFEEFQYLFSFFPGRFPHEDALRAQFQIANSVMEQRHMSVYGLKGFTDPQPALPMFRRIAENAPFWEHAAEVQFRIGRVLEATGEHLDAVDAYAVVFARYPDAPLAGDAAFRRAMCLHRLSRSSPRDEMQCRAALSAFAAFLRDYPKHDDAREAETYRDELGEHLASMYYDRALFYDRIARKPKAAAIAYRDFLQKFPLSDKAGDATERLGELAATAEDNPAKAEP